MFEVTTEKMSIEEKQQELVEEFAFFEDWADKYEHIISLGKEVPEMNEEHKKDENLIKDLLAALASQPAVKLRCARNHRPVGGWQRISRV